MVSRIVIRGQQRYYYGDGDCLEKPLYAARVQEARTYSLGQSHRLAPDALLDLARLRGWHVSSVEGRDGRRRVEVTL